MIWSVSGGGLQSPVAGRAQAGTVRTALADQGFKNAVAAHGATLGIDVKTVERNPAGKGFVPQPSVTGQPVEWLSTP